MKSFLFSIMILAGFAMQVSASPMDVNKDGKVSKQEFLDAAAVKAKRDGKEFKAKAEENRFAARDKNGDGFLTADELKGKPAPKAKDEGSDDQ